MKRIKVIAAVVSVFAALFAFAAHAFAATPCAGPFYEPEMPRCLAKSELDENT